MRGAQTFTRRFPQAQRSAVRGGDEIPSENAVARGGTVGAKWDRMKTTQTQTDDMGRALKICEKCGAKVGPEDIRPVGADDFHAFQWVAGKGYTRVQKTVRRVCRGCVRG